MLLSLSHLPQSPNTYAQRRFVLMSRDFECNKDIGELEQIPWIVCPFLLPGISRTAGLPMDVDRISIFVGLNGFGFRRDVGTCSGLQDYGIVEDFEHCTILFSSSLYPSTKEDCEGILDWLDLGIGGEGRKIGHV